MTAAACREPNPIPASFQRNKTMNASHDHAYYHARFQQACQAAAASGLPRPDWFRFLSQERNGGRSVSAHAGEMDDSYFQV